MNRALSNKKNQFYVALIVSAFIIAAQWFLMKDVETNGVWEWLISSFFLFFILPIVVIKFYFKGNLADFHLSFKFDFKDVLTVFVFGGLFIGLFFLLLVKLSWYKFFPASNLMFGGKGPFMFFEFIVFPLILFFQEFFFRGFLLRSAEKAIGVIGGILIQLLAVLIFEYVFGATLHFVIFFSILVVSLFVSWLVFRTRTVFLTFLISWLVNIVINFTVFYYLNIP